MENNRIVKWKEEPEKRTGHRASRHLGLKISIAAVSVLLAVVVWVGYYIIETYTVKTVYVDGNAHYTDEEIMDMVMTGYLGHNSIYLNFKYRNKEIRDIPFVSAIEVEIVAPDTVRINVYEKSLAGYVTYLGRYMYFDRDGTIIESSTERSAGVPEVMGLSFDHVVMNERLPVENEEIFGRILDITQSLSKYELEADKLFFDRDYMVTLYFDKVKVRIGDNTSIDEKFARLQSILPELTGKSGTLQMESFTSESKIVPFQEEKG